ncbi:MAG: DUF1080 domain-containing protein [Planctomycetia bacterium]|nr:DUF1080 domain-containing protein [Planctomycetia bacterium]
MSTISKKALRIIGSALVVILLTTDVTQAQVFPRLRARLQGIMGCEADSDFCGAADATFDALPCCDYFGTQRSLFNGTDLTGWTDVKGGAPGKGWVVEDGMIVHEENSGDLYVDGKFENFILEFEFKISEKGNSGVKYRSWNTEGFGLGCEYQIFDDINVPDNPPRYQTASLYDVIVPRENTAKLKMGEFNKGKIIVVGDHIEHYLNGELIVSVDVGSQEWNDAVAKSKFHDVPEFGTTKVGRVFLQDHGSKVWFKNLYITELQPTNAQSQICF